MAGAKRRTGYRKQVTDSVLFELVEPTAGQKVAVILKSHGSNLLELQAQGGAVGVGLLPTKFKKLVWVKRGDFLLVTESDGDFTTAAGSAGRVRFLIDTVLYPDQVKHLRSIGKWPVEMDALSAHVLRSEGQAETGTASVGSSGTQAAISSGKWGGGVVGPRVAGGGASIAAAMLLASRTAADCDEDDESRDASLVWTSRATGERRRDFPSCAGESENEVTDDEEEAKLDSHGNTIIPVEAAAAAALSTATGAVHIEVAGT